MTKDAAYQIRKETEAAKKLLSMLRDSGEDDDAEIVESAIEGETNLNEAIASVIDMIDEEEIVITGGEAKIAAIRARIDAKKSRVEKLRASVEQLEAAVEPWHMSAVHQDEIPDEPEVVDFKARIEALEAELAKITEGSKQQFAARMSPMRGYWLSHDHTRLMLKCEALEAENARLREALREAAETLEWASRRMKGNCSGADVNAVILAARRAREGGNNA